MAESIKDIYTRLEESQKTTVRGDKAAKIREFVMDVATQTEKSKLVVAALFNTACELEIVDKKDRSYFTSVIAKRWATTTENNAVYVDIAEESKE